MIRWPRQVEAGTTSDAVVGAIDLYPTVLDALGLERPASHVIDGVSFLPVLRQTGQLQRDAYFTWFPHLIPAVSVRQENWKLIRRFEPHPQYPEMLELYDLANDLGETHNLAGENPEKVAELNASIDAFMERTGALAPRPNPAYQPRADVTAGREPSSGLVPKMCELSLIPGALRMTGAGRTPFLGTAQVRHADPMTLQLRVRSTVGGSGRVQWQTAGQDRFPEQGQQAAFTLAPGDDWQELTIPLPVQAMTRIIRLYLPADRAPVEIQSIRFLREERTIKRWDFTHVQP
jgi:hypothetical protein